MTLPGEDFSRAFNSSEMVDKSQLTAKTGLYLWSNGNVEYYGRYTFEPKILVQTKQMFSRTNPTIDKMVLIVPITGAGRYKFVYQTP